MLLSGCLGDPPPAPDVQPLEIIAGSSDPEHGPCSLNVDEVAAGTHEVTPVTEAGRVVVRILDPSGAVLFERTLESPSAKDGGEQVRPEEQESVRLEAGDHQVECVLPDGTRSVALLVVTGDL